MEIKAIGIIHNEYLDLDSIPGQGYTSEVESVIEIFEEYEAALLGIEKKISYRLYILVMKRIDQFLYQKIEATLNTQEYLQAEALPDLTR